MTLEDKKFYIAELVLILEFLHRNGIAHRDVKPENLMLGPDNHLRIIDFGTAMFFDIPTANQEFIKNTREQVAKMKAKYAAPDPNIEYDDDEESSHNTSQNEVHRNTFVGTPEYVSPEMLSKSESGPASDLWALGVIIYRLLAGKLPFCESTEFLIFQKIKNSEFDFPSVKSFLFF